MSAESQRRQWSRPIPLRRGPEGHDQVVPVYRVPRSSALEIPHLIFYLGTGKVRWKGPAGSLTLSPCLVSWAESIRRRAPVATGVMPAV